MKIYEYKLVTGLNFQAEVDNGEPKTIQVASAHIKGTEEQPNPRFETHNAAVVKINELAEEGWEPHMQIFNMEGRVSLLFRRKKTSSGFVQHIPRKSLP